MGTIDTIAEWTSTELTRFIQKVVDSLPSKVFSIMEADDAIIHGKLTIKDQVVFSGLDDRLVGTTGQPAFAGTWTASSNKPRFFKDPHSVIHLEGAVNGGVSGTTIFTLPPGYRPNYQGLFPVRVTGPATGTIIVNTDGTVVHESGAVTLVALDGIVFKARTT